MNPTFAAAVADCPALPAQFRKVFEAHVPTCPGCQSETSAEIRCEECRQHKCGDCTIVHGGIPVCKGCASKVAADLAQEIAELEAFRVALLAGAQC